LVTDGKFLGGLLGIFETAFPGRIRSCYVEGSYADGTELATSDIDLVIVFKDQFAGATERDRAQSLAEHCAAVSSVELDISLVDDTALKEGVYPATKYGSRCVYGEDRREALAVLPIEEWTRQCMHAAYWLLVTVFNRGRIVTPPVGYPEPADDFLGYTLRTVRLQSGVHVPSTRDLIRVTGWIATALLAWRAKVYVARKSECHVAYRRQIGDEWAPFLDDIYRLCRLEWGYLIPAGEAERRALRNLCEQALAFENHFLGLYREYLLAQLGRDDTESPRIALRFLESIAYRDEHVLAAVQRIAEGSDAELRQAAQRVRALLE
jgi:hypothetical protein